jgi:adenylate kinase family enzyme
MRRVVVVGVTGVGKTTFASALSERLGVPHVELDALYWQPQWTPRDPDEFRARIVAEVARDAWVIDGNYSATRDQVWSSADTLIWLNYPLLLIFDRLLRRTLRRGVKREILWGTNQERLWTQFFSPQSLFLWALQRYPHYRREYPRLMHRPEYAHLHVIEFHSPRQASDWLLAVGR